MAFGRLSAFYLPSGGNAGSSLWGSDVHKVLASADGADDNSTVTAHGVTVGAEVNRTVQPYTSNNTDTTEADYGWAIDPADLTVSGGRRYFAAGTHTLHIRLTAPVGFTTSYTLSLYVYKVSTAAAGRTRTLIASNANTGDFPASGNALPDAAATVSVPAVVLEADESIQWSYEFAIRGTTLTGKNVQHHTGTSSGTVARIETPPLGTMLDTTGSSDGAGSASGSASKVLGTGGDAAGSSTAAAAAGPIGAGIGVTTGNAVVTAVGAQTIAAAGAADGAAAASGVGAARFGAVAEADGAASGSAAAGIVLGAVAEADGQSDGQAVGNGIFAGIGQAASDSEAEGVGAPIGAGVADANGDSAADGFSSSLSAAVGQAAGSAEADGVGGKVLGSVGTCEIGGEPYPDGLLRLRTDGRVEAVRTGPGPLPSGALRIVALP